MNVRKAQRGVCRHWSQERALRARGNTDDAMDQQANTHKPILFPHLPTLCPHDFQE